LQKVIFRTARMALPEQPLSSLGFAVTAEQVAKAIAGESRKSRANVGFPPIAVTRWPRPRCPPMPLSRRSPGTRSSMRPHGAAPARRGSRLAQRAVGQNRKGCPWVFRTHRASLIFEGRGAGAGLASPANRTACFSWSKAVIAAPLQAAFVTRHMRERCGTDALIGSICVFGMMRLILAPADDSGS